DEALRVRARRRADHEDQRRAQRDDLLDGVLPVLGRVADVVGAGAAQVAEAPLEHLDGRSDVVQGERRLADHGQGLPVRFQPGRLLRRLDDDDLLRPLALRPDHLDVVAVADERDQVAAVGVASGLRMHLRDERADGVDDAKPAALAVVANGRGDAVRRQDADRTLRYLLLVVDENRAEPLEAPDDMLVVDDVVADVDRRPVLLEQPLDDLDRAVDAGAEGAGRGEQDALRHELPSSAFSARRTSPSAWRVARGSRRSALARPAGRGRPAGVTASTSGPSGRAGVSETARTQPSRRPVAARIPLSMSTASAPVASRRRSRSAGSSAIRSVAAIVPGRAPGMPRPGPAQSSRPCPSTIRVASITVPTSRLLAGRSPPATPNETRRPAGTPREAPIPTTAARRPALRAARASA